jgi:hypothetical protein
MPLPQALQDFNIENSTVQVWLFKKSITSERQIRFTGRWINTDANLDQALKEAAIQKRENILEVNSYGLLSGANDGIALHISTIETHAGAITAEAMNPVQSRKVTRLRKFKILNFTL